MTVRRTALILAAIKNGTVTSPELARRIGVSRPLMSVTLYDLASHGVIVRGRGRHPICWRIAQEASP